MMNVSPDFPMLLTHSGLLSLYFQQLEQCLAHAICRCLIAKSCLILCDPVDYSAPVSSFHRIFQARILEQVAIPISRGSS